MRIDGPPVRRPSLVIRNVQCQAGGIEFTEMTCHLFKKAERSQTDGLLTADMMQLYLL